MRRLERWHMYFSIQRMKQEGLKITQIARRLELSRNTVYKFIEMNPDQFREYLEQLESRKKKLDGYERAIVEWLREYPDLSAAQVQDWLKERYPVGKISEGTVRNYVRELRSKHGIPKTMQIRQYEAVEDPPMGHQAQVDFGETKLRNPQGNLVRLWFIAFVLSHSRYKYVQWQDRPFTTKDVIQMHEDAFSFLGGFPKELVYDQDHLLLTSENHGDLLLTHEFAGYMKERGFHIRMCRKQDPESKGRIENVVKYVKRNFARHRLFSHIDKLNEDCVAWLHRTGNASMHHTTKKIPAEVFALEREHLRPVHTKINPLPSSITRTVRKDNTIWYEGNRYSVPLGTYDGTDKQVGLQVTEASQLNIYDVETGQVLAEHPLGSGSGKLIQNTNHKRDRTKGIAAYIQTVAEAFPVPETAAPFLHEIYKRKPRYIRDQLQLIGRALDGVDSPAVEKALHYCVKHRLYRATDFADAVEHYKRRQQQISVSQPLVKPLMDINTNKRQVKPQVRDFSAYQAILSGGQR
ncbi:IS21 family transposase [Paenibacillus sp. JMULE4]|uniref:IS21 family transposase n=1 Tax=Paenibacillus TaxID=44249 RepID=UPI0020C64878|nr:IS21 family transposase [Paenibacillus sp. JMULE4]NTZ20968.1 IS21 family transposase [Paenibacillus sp. JMULE4]